VDEQREEGEGDQDGEGRVTNGQHVPSDCEWNWLFPPGGIIVDLVRLTRVAGGILWRETPAGRQVAVVHRRRQGDWSLPKGRLEAGERWRSAALREVAEETGCSAVIRAFAGAKLFVNRQRPKLVLYWHMGILEEGAVEVDGEVDEVAWLPHRDAVSILDHPSDRILLVRAVANYRAGPEASLGPDLPTGDLRQLLLVDGRDDDPRCVGALEIVARAASRQAVPATRTRMRKWSGAAPRPSGPG
jgi:ADP-ribose pyrophosphatase YjhB (NUDIX family)